MDLLVVKGLTKKFKAKTGDITAVDKASFAARSGEIFGLLGPNGAGKTTTIRLIATTLQATDGTALVDGFDIRQDPENVRQRIGVLTTDIGVYDRFTGRENLRYYGRLYSMSAGDLDRRISELIDLLAMADFIDKRAGKYSTGMKQKLAIARSVIHDPKIIIFDEPTSGLDVLAAQTVMRFMRRSRDLGRLVILSTHQMSDAERLCDRVAIIHRGSIIAIDTLDDIKQKTRTDNLENAFLRLVQGRPEQRAKSETARVSDDRTAAPEKKRDMKVVVQQLRVAAYFVIVIGLVPLFLSDIAEWAQTMGTALVLIGALGIMVTRTYLKKHSS